MNFWTFDPDAEAAEAYKKARPGYPEELYGQIFLYAHICAGSRALEVGPGPGNATLPFLEAGCSVLAIEPGRHFSSLCNKRFENRPYFSIITGRFEEASLAREYFDLVFSATAFHWIPEKKAYTSAWSALKAGGAFARFANHPYAAGDNPELRETLDKIYGKHYRPFYPESKKISEFGKEQAREIAMIAEKYGFSDISFALYHRKRILSAREYIQLLCTYSDHMSLPKSTREKLFQDIKDAIAAYGGNICIFDTIDLELARKPG